MIAFINGLTGTLMQVPDDRKEEYLAAGHRLAADAPPDDTTEKPVEVRAEKPVKTRTRTTAKK